MTTIAILLLLVAAASTSPSPGDGARRVRDVSSGSKSGSGAMSFSSSSSGSSSGVGARTGFDGGQGYNGVNSGGFAFPDYGAAQNSYPVPVDFNALFQHEINSRAGFSQPDYSGGFVFPEVPNYGPGANNYGGGFGASNNAPDAYASASASLSPRGGFGSASIGPPVQTRMGSVPPSGGGGGDFSVFSASSSSSSDIDGVKKSSKEATSVINDNGKITTYHVSNP
ncbi:uncharacterized protein [Periplaneta americana]|uniref:uncharacterized protein isoform X3 n=1 Tax=Periplaneta americana TaxID=6978 RepID=UPI0037E72E91